MLPELRLLLEFLSFQNWNTDMTKPLSQNEFCRVKISISFYPTEAIVLRILSKIKRKNKFTPIVRFYLLNRKAILILDTVDDVIMTSKGENFNALRIKLTITDINLGSFFVFFSLKQELCLFCTKTTYTWQKKTK